MKPTARSFRRILPLLVGVAIPSLASAQTAAPDPRIATPGLSVPTIKVLGIGTFNSNARPEVWKPMLANEARAATRLYLDGKIDQWYVKQDNTGIVFVLNATSAGEARSIIDQLPAVHAGLMQFEMIELGPLSPLKALLAP